ncbi:MAG TPA: E2/UBC family protein [Candidatus Hydrogenedentes bacterium]|mgnify:CR=1 FL=1|jgi:hypothetical protein|nr:E2/UBC family protein [Candidatus Hydrogenedentota bacterium]HPJ99816.1 E2/UBC family protein [Candidatus Hydrogenedentota bacterium]
MQNNAKNNQTASRNIHFRGQNFAVPVNSQGIVTGEDIKDHLGLSDDTILVRDTGSGFQSVQPSDEVADGARCAAVGRFATAGRDIRRLNAELQLLMTMYGNDRVSWPRTQNWVMIRDFPLPAGWNFKTSDIVVILPDNYGFGEPLKHCFVDPALRFLHNGNWKKIDHYFDSERGYTPHPEFNAKGWRYLCLHMKTWTPDSWVQTYLDAITTFLSDPFAGWPTS